MIKSKSNNINVELALETSGMGTWEWDLITNQGHWSDKVFELFGFSKEDFKNDYPSFIDCVHPDDQAYIKERISNALTTGQNYRVEHRVIQPDGRITWFEGIGNFILNAKGEKIKLIGLVWEITERKKTSQKAHSPDLLFNTISIAIKDLFIDDWDTAINNSMKLLGETTGVDRVYIFENGISSSRGPITSQRYEWNSGTAKAQLENAEFQNSAYSDRGSLYETISKGNPWSAIVRTMLNVPYKKLLQSEETLSLLIFPIFVRNGFWGYIGFDECKYERKWTETEYSGLRLFSSTVSAALERRLFQEELRSSELGYKGLFNTVGESIYIQDLSGIFLDVNEQACDMYGYEKEEFIGKTPEFLSAPGKNDSEALKKMYEEAYGGELQIFEWWGIKKSGELFLKEVRINKGSYYGQEVLIATAWDITERKKAENELQESEKRFRALHEASFGGISLHHKGVILDCNQGLSNMTGYTREELVGMDGLNLIAQEYQSTVMQHILEGYEKLYDVEGIRKDGTRYDVEIHGKNIPYKGQNIRVTEFRDITERKRAKQKIIEQNTRLASIAEDLRYKNAQLEEFTQIVSHNLRSPIGNILSLITLFEDATSDGERNVLLNYLRDAGKMTMTTLSELNEVLKIKQNQNIESQNLRFDHTLQKIVKMLQGEIVKTGTELHSDFTEVPAIHYPGIYLESIVLNLVSNSLKYRDPSRKTVIKIHSYIKGDSICLDVADNGLGINLEKYGHQIFKLRKTFHELPESRGVGLFLIKNQIEAMGGQIEVNSQELQGTTFTVIFAVNDQG